MIIILVVWKLSGLWCWNNKKNLFKKRSRNNKKRFEPWKTECREK